jgi:hypothetical protein
MNYINIPDQHQKNMIDTSNLEGKQAGQLSQLQKTKIGEGIHQLD